MKNVLRAVAALAVLGLVAPAFAEEAKPAEPAKTETKAAPKAHKKAAKKESKKAEEKKEAAKPAEAAPAK